MTTSNIPLPVYGEAPSDVHITHRKAVYAIIKEDNAIAVVRTPRGCFLPGGGVDSGETDEQALVRELFEELGWSVSITRCVDSAYQYHYSEVQQKYFHTLGIFYEAKYVASICEPVEDDHTLAWLTPGQACEELRFEYMQEAVKKCLKDAI